MSAAPRPLSICQVSAAYYPYPSGVSELVHHLSEELRQRGHRVQILTTSFGDDGPECRDVTRIGKAILLPMNKSFATVPFDLAMSGKVKRFLRSNAFDVVHLNGFFPPDISYYALHHSQSVNVVSFLTVGFRNYGPGAWVWNLMSGGLNRQMHGRIALTQGALKYIQPFFPGEFRVIPPGVDTTRFRPAASRKPQAASILFVGRLDKRKGLDVLLRAMPEVVSRFPEARLTVVGKGPMEAESRRLAHELGLRSRVEFKGYAANNDLPAFYAAADVYCSPALGGEAFGIVLLEALACGTSVVASDITGYNEVVTHGETGLLCPPNDPAALARTLIEMLSRADLREKFRTAGLKKAEELSWPRIAEQVEEYYRELLERRRAGSR
jgi:phosphatidylinositol alpha-mannosyltransferase